MKVKIVDSTFYPFGGRSLSLAGDNAGRHPESFSWDGSDGHADIKFFTDIRLSEAKEDPAKKKNAIIIEPRSVSDKAYKRVDPNHFFAVLTHDAELLKRGRPFAFYPFGGSWIGQEYWRVAPKDKLVSMIVGRKRSAEGHKLRHAVAKRFGEEDLWEVDLWGQPYTKWMPDKRVMLTPYMYSIVVENDRRDYWFTEKLIDCFSVGTVPIYCGCPSISSFFDIGGILSFSTLDELGRILLGVGPNDYSSRMGAILRNMEEARKYYCAEDWIYDNYPKLFEL